jgi:hypothetical protein
MGVVRLGRDEHLGFGTQRQVLAPVMECFGRHSHEHLPLHRAEIAFSFLLKKSIPEMRLKCERFQAFLGVSPIYLGTRVAVSDARRGMENGKKEPDDVTPHDVRSPIL